MESHKGDHCSFVLLAEFDIDSGAQLTYQFPQPLGTDEGLVAHLMLPDGAERHLEDWTIFFLNQTSFNTISPVLALEGDEPNETHSELLYVLNLVRTKHDKTARRGAVVKAMAICTRHPFIQIFKPVLLLALDDYFSNPSQECLSRLFDAINNMDISAAPTLSRAEKLIMRSCERKDVFSEKFGIGPSDLQHYVNGHNGTPPKAHRTTSSNGSHSSEEFSRMRAGTPHTNGTGGRERSMTQSSTASHAQQVNGSSPSETSFTLGGSAVWVGDESGLLENQVGVAVGSGPGSVTSVGSSVLASTGRGRKSTDASSSSSHNYNSAYSGAIPTSSDPYLRTGLSKDTHFYQTTISYKGHHLPIKVPLSTFPEEVGEYSLIQLISTFSTPTVTVTGPIHPHLHTNGNATHPIVILFNALVTGKRILFLGHSIPAGQVASYVLSACALGSGCGTVLRGFVERAFPYASLAGGEDWVSIPGYIAGVTNPIFETSGNWDLLMDVGAGRVVVHKDIHSSCPPTVTPPAIVPLMNRTGTMRNENSAPGDDDVKRAEKEGKDSTQSSKSESLDNMFIEDLIAAISFHFGENIVRLRFAEYVSRFVRLASRYEEVAVGSTKLSWPSAPFVEGSLGSGIVFPDETAAIKELAVNTSRIEGWRRSTSYQYCVQDYQSAQATDSIQGFDVRHQLSRLRMVKDLPDSEVELIMSTLRDNVESYEQVVELLSYAPPLAGGLQPLSFGLFHQQEPVREATVDLFNQLRSYPVGVIFLQALNHFQRYAYVRQAHARESRSMKEQPCGHLAPPAPPMLSSRTPSNRSEISLGAS
ncbi:spindle pole body interacting protein [Coniophora puteana RWD-64-598 SS2]|uniref:Spindle pole body interacting protein n=1 Tax=Coniophora puteana (strain RWD-64-598) TaxID=741705 RepID=A0A5M3MH99_CONPW|nr:spindle pole body interacting protein [Coniophora puteana RWD-64-598 SS2]EIW78386.1 spindle pole body interacting protein [Coniophora puteana RWD-64-598 SS2]